MLYKTTCTDVWYVACRCNLWQKIVVIVGEYQSTQLVHVAYGSVMWLAFSFGQVSNFETIHTLPQATLEYILEVFNFIWCENLHLFELGTMVNELFVNQTRN